MPVQSVANSIMGRVVLFTGAVITVIAASAATAKGMQTLLQAPAAFDIAALRDRVATWAVSG